MIDLAKSRGLIFVIVIAAFLLVRCSPGYNLDPRFQSISASHRVVALLPPTVTIPEEKLPRNITPDGVKRIQDEKTRMLQGRLYSNFLDMQQKGKFSVEFQDIDLTNALLAKAGLIDKFAQISPQELGETLGVDAVLMIDFRQTSPGSKGFANALKSIGLGTGANHIYIDARVMDCQTGKMLGQFTGDGEGDLMASPERLPKIKFNDIARKFPYKHRKQK